MRQVKADDIRAALRKSRGALIATAFFSLVLNMLMLSGPLYMLQIYDRVLTSRSMPTLIALSILVAVLYALSGFLEFVRSRILTRISLAFDQTVGERVFDASTRLGLIKGKPVASPLRDFEALRQFLSSPGPSALFDMPWAPIYLALLFMFHWLLGAVALGGAVALLVIALATERATQSAVARSTEASRRSSVLADAGQNNAEVLAAMGMLASYRQRWLGANREALLIQSQSSDTITGLTAVSKTLRMLLQSAILAIGAALAIHGDVSMGAIIAGSILMGRALAPVEQAIAHWRGFVRARQAHRALRELLDALPPQTDRIELPTPNGHLDVRGIRMAPPGTQRLVVNNVSFAVGPGQILAIAGPSASGKSTLARALVGVWPVAGGEIRLDGARLDQWDPQRLGHHIGYVPQDVELFSGSVRDNISRFLPDATDADVIAAAKLARAHSMILDLPQGYDTELGAFGGHLSAGQKQRIALARALYGNPVLLVFDEPNSNLDSDGDAALIEAIGELKPLNRTVITVTHRSSAIARADLLLVMERGQVRAFGPRDDVLRSLSSSAGVVQGPTGAPMTSAPSAARPAPHQARPAPAMPGQQQVAASQPAALSAQASAARSAAPLSRPAPSAGPQPLSLSRTSDQG